jgi:hypothetical protein
MREKVEVICQPSKTMQRFSVDQVNSIYINTVVSDIPNNLATGVFPGCYRTFMLHFIGMGMWCPSWPSMPPMPT